MRKTQVVEDPGYFGGFLRNARIEAGLSMRDLADKLKVSHVFVGEVERGVKARLPEGKWKLLIKALPGMTEKKLEEWNEFAYCPTCYRTMPREFRAP